MKLFKTVSSFFTNKVTTAIEKATKPEDMFRDAARQLISEVDRLRHAQVSSNHEIAKIKKVVEKHENLQAIKEAEIRMLQTSGAEISKNHVIIALQHRNIVAGLKKKSEDLEAMNVEIEKSVVELDQKLSDVSLNLEILRLNAETQDMGLTVPEDVIAAVGHVNVNVDTIVTKVDVLLGGSSTMASVTSGDIALYMEELTKKTA